MAGSVFSSAAYRDGLDELEALGRAAAVGFAAEAVLLADLAGRTSRQGWDSADPFESLLLDVAGTLVVGQRAAGDRLDQAVHLCSHLPGTLSRLQAGTLGVAQARVLVAETRQLDEVCCAEVEQRVLIDAAELPPARLRERVRRAVLAVDAAAAARRAAAARADRRVWLRAGEDGTAMLFALLPAEHARAVLLSLTEQARAMRAAGDGRTVDQLRADLLVELLTGRRIAPTGPPLPTPSPAAGCGTAPGTGPGSGDPAHPDPTPSRPTPPDPEDIPPWERPTAGNISPAEPDGTAPGAADQGAADLGAADPGGAGPGVAGSHHDADRGAGVDPVTGGDLHEAQGEKDPPPADGGPTAAPPFGEGCRGGLAPPVEGGPVCACGGVGPRPAVVLRPPQVVLHVPLATALGVSDEPAHLDGIGPICAAQAREMTASAELRALFVDQSTGQPLAAPDKPLHRPAPDDPPLSPPAMRDLLRDLTLTPVTVPADTRQPQHDPSAPLARFVRLRDHRCDGPGCSVPADRCELDHVTPWPKGPTSAGNLKARSPRCHHAKHHGWTIQPRPDGGSQWTSPSGRTYQVHPLWHRPPDPAAPLPDPQRLVENDRQLLDPDADDDRLGPWLNDDR